MPYKGRDMDAAHARTRCGPLAPTASEGSGESLQHIIWMFTLTLLPFANPHSAMGLSDEDFDTVVSTLGATMKEFGMNEEQIAQAVAVTETTRDAVRACLLTARRHHRSRHRQRASNGTTEANAGGLLPPSSPVGAGAQVLGRAEQDHL